MTKLEELKDIYDAVETAADAAACAATDAAYEGAVAAAEEAYADFMADVWFKAARPFTSAIDSTWEAYQAELNKAQRNGKRKL
jgi:membrane-bound lytic murein transglycosylase MltF